MKQRFQRRLVGLGLAMITYCIIFDLHAQNIKPTAQINRGSTPILQLLSPFQQTVSRNASSTPVPQCQPIITTIAGTGAAGFSGDEGPAISAELKQPRGISFDSSGNLYFADSWNGRLRMITPDKKIHTIAGTGRPITNDSIWDLGRWNIKDGTSAIKADFFSISEVFVDGQNNAYLADGNQLLKMTTDHILHPVSGKVWDFFTGYSGGDTQFNIQAKDAFLQEVAGIVVDSNGIVYLTDNAYSHQNEAGEYLIAKINPDGKIWPVTSLTSGGPADDGPALNVQIGCASGLAMDSANNIFIADLCSNKIRKIDSDGTIHTVASNIVQPNGIAVDGAGNVYFGAEDHKIRKMTPDGIMNVVAGGGNDYPGDGEPATQVKLKNPSRVAVDRGGSLYISDADDNKIRKVTGCHLACAGSMCAPASGAGPDECSADIDCVHLECQNDSCVTMPGKGRDLCTSTQSCLNSKYPHKLPVQANPLYDPLRDRPVQQKVAPSQSWWHSLFK